MSACGVLARSILQGSSTNTYGSVSDLVDRVRQSRGFAFIYSASSAAAIIGPIAFGTIGDRLGLVAPMVALAVAVGLTLPLILLLPIRTPKQSYQRGNLLQPLTDSIGEDDFSAAAAQCITAPPIDSA